MTNDESRMTKGTAGDGGADSPVVIRRSSFSAPAILALFIRSVREDTRSRAMLWTRIGLAGAVLYYVWNTQTLSRRAGGAAGLRFFESLVWMNFTFISIAGLSYFATPVTEEKEEGTLGLLRMTDLSPFAILLGKSTSRFVGGALLLLVQFPFALLAITLGGVRLGQIAGAYTLLGAYMFLVCNAGLLASVIARRAGGAAVWAGVIGFTWTVWPAPLLGYAFNSIFEPGILGPGTNVGHYVVISSLGELLSTRGSPAEIARTVAWLILGGIGAFAIARWKFDTFCDEGGEAPVSVPAPGTPPAPPAGQPEWLIAANAAPRRPWDTGTLWRGDAVAWRDYQFIHGGAQVAWIKVGLYILGILVVSVIIGSNGFRPGNAIGTAIFFLSLLVLSCECAFAASRSFRIERKELTLSSLYTLPLDLSELVRSKRRAIILSLAPVSVFLALGALLVVASGDGFVSDFGIAMFWITQGIAFFIAQLVFNVRLITWLSLRMKWGALPVALALSWFANMLIIPPAVLIFREASLLILICATAVAAAMMKNALHVRIAQAAAGE
jgi:ABC-type transport system involved in multi-copper enzyme maturation permease subunit